MAATISAISGPYHGSWGGDYVGVTEDGFELEHTFYSEPIRGDNMGDSIQDEVHRGADVAVSMTLIEWAKAMATAGNVAGGDIQWPVAAPGVVGVIGDNVTDQFGALVLTAMPNTPAAANPATITFGLARLANNFPIRQLYASRLRRLPVRMQAYPQGFGGAGSAYSYNEANRWYVTT
tara:strand:- start:1313 stop:1846 length:534 start_codon:yes stop_codon:yes gene_type:complete